MATTKKTTKKAAPRAAAKPAAVKKAPVKKTAAKKQPAKKSTVKTAEMRSFRVAKDAQSFKNFQITRQTVYWIILIAFIIFAQLWILKLQIEVASIIDAQQAQLQSY